MGVLAILSGILVDLELTGLVTFALTVLFFWTALYSAYQIYPFGGQVRRILTLMTDHRDSGKIVLTPIYLIVSILLSFECYQSSNSYFMIIDLENHFDRL